MEKARVGFVGLGLMGKGMATNLARAGFSLTVYNRTRAKAESLAAEIGCTVADSPRRVAELSEIVITMVSDVPDVEAVYLHTDGIIEAARVGLTCCDMSTVGAACVLRVASALKEKGTPFVDAPVSGGSWGAQNGTLSIMAGGSDEAFETCRPLFEAMGKKIVHCGDVGSGQTVKLINQVVGAINLEAAAEGILLAQASGAKIEAVLDAVGAGAAGSWAWANLAPRMSVNDFAPGFKVAHQIKDLRLALEAAATAKIDLPGVRLVLAHLEKVSDGGGGENGTQSVIGAI